ncbi:MAG: hypothetical protein JWN86_1897 [Planctomycetota bacterium]|nr:hypothetical protein [Planctomycetota bacterium]
MNPTRSETTSPRSRPPVLATAAGLAALFLTLLHHGPSRLSAQAAVRDVRAAAGATLGLLPFQGRLTTAAGAPLPEGEAKAVFSLYDSPTGGAAAWTSGPLKFKVASGGLVHATLGGEANPLEAKVDFSREVYLGVKVDDPSNATLAADEPEMLPRVRILPVLFANNAGRLVNHSWEELDFRLKRLERKTASIADPDSEMMPAGLGED